RRYRLRPYIEGEWDRIRNGAPLPDLPPGYSHWTVMQRRADGTRMRIAVVIRDDHRPGVGDDAALRVWRVAVELGRQRSEALAQGATLDGAVWFGSAGVGGQA
ncbi:hypothetical protein, partial [Paracraurococcus ruber]